MDLFNKKRIAALEQELERTKQLLSGLQNQVWSLEGAAFLLVNEDGISTGLFPHGERVTAIEIAQELMAVAGLELKYVQATSTGVEFVRSKKRRT